MFLTLALAVTVIGLGWVGVWLSWTRHKLWLRVEQLDEEVDALIVENASVVSDRNKLAEELAFTEPWPLWRDPETPT